MKMNRKKFRLSMSILWGIAALIQLLAGAIYLAGISLFVAIAYFIKMKKGEKKNARN